MAVLEKQAADSGANARLARAMLEEHSPLRKQLRDAESAAARARQAVEEKARLVEALKQQQEAEMRGITELRSTRGGASFRIVA